MLSRYTFEGAAGDDQIVSRLIGMIFLDVLKALDVNCEREINAVHSQTRPTMLRS